RHTRFSRDWSSDVCSSDLFVIAPSQFGTIGSFENGLAPAGINNLEGCIDRTGKWVVPPAFAEVDSFGAESVAFARQAYPPIEKRSEERRVGKACGSWRGAY